MIGHNIDEVLPYHLDLYDEYLSVLEEDIEFELRGHSDMPWADFVLNPRRLRGSDFLMRWSQGQWSEDRLMHAVNATSEFFTIPYGPSGTAPDDPREFELYFERLVATGLGKVKRPDLLVFRISDKNTVDALVESVGGIAELPFTRDEDPQIRQLLSLSILAVEAENSLWRARKMPHYGVAPKPQTRLGGQSGFPKTAVLPTVILKDEDLIPLLNWQEANGVPIHQWHVFFDVAYGIAFDKVRQLVQGGFIEATRQIFQAPGGPTTEKMIYKIYYTYAYTFAEATEEPNLVATYLEDKNGHILPYVKFEGGQLRVTGEALNVLTQAAIVRGR